MPTPKRDQAKRPHLMLIHVDTPIFNETVANSEPEVLPTFEAIDSHEQFMHRHRFADWLYDVTIRRLLKEKEVQP